MNQDSDRALGAGDIFIAASDEKTLYHALDLKAQVMILPLDRLPGKVDHLLHPRQLRAGTLKNRLLGSALDLWFNEVRAMDATQAELLENTIIGTLYGILGTGPNCDLAAAGMEAAQGQAIRAFIDEHLGNPDIGVAQIAKTFQMSRAGVYRHFAARGGVAQYITRRRLEASITLLASDMTGRGEVAQVSERVGFNDPQYFSRVFKKHFGFSPTDAQDLAPVP